MSKNKLITVAATAVVVVVAIVLVFSLGNDRDTQKTDVDLYFISSDGTGIVSETQTIKYRNDNEFITNTLDRLRKGPVSGKLGAIMPKDTEVKEIELVGGGFLKVNFSEQFLAEDASRNVLNVYAVVKTLCSSARVSSVQVLVEGEPVKDRDGKPLEYTSASDINLQTEEYKSELKEVTLYFADSEEKKLVRETRTIKITDQQPVEQYLLNELIKGPATKGLKSLLSDNTTLVSVDVENNICYLNFKSDFLNANSGTPEHDKLVIYSIVNSLTELRTMFRVQFYMDGKRVEKFGSMDIKDYIDRNEDIIA